MSIALAKKILANRGITWNNPLDLLRIMRNLDRKDYLFMACNTLYKNAMGQ